MFRLNTFGGCFLERDGRRLEGLSAQRKGLGLLARLASAGDAGLSRDAVAACLWPESDESRAAASLKQQVHSLRQQLGSSDVLLGPSTLRLNPALITPARLLTPGSVTVRPVRLVLPTFATEIE